MRKCILFGCLTAAAFALQATEINDLAEVDTSVALSMVGCDETPDWRVPAAWRPRSVVRDGREMVFVESPLHYKPPIEKQIRAYMRTNEVYRNIVPSLHVFVKNKPDGTFTFDFPSVDPQLSSPEQPFILNPCTRPTSLPITYFFGKPALGEDYQKFLADHPGFICFHAISEILFDTINPSEPKWNKNCLSRINEWGRKLTPEQIAEIRKRPWVGNPRIPDSTNRFEIIDGLYTDHIKREIEIYGNDPKHAMMLESVNLTPPHLGAFLGCGVVGIETTHSHCNHNLQAAFSRGAARQFQIPWFWYIASFHYGVNREGKFIYSEGTLFSEPRPDAKKFEAGPNFGLSMSAMRRERYMGWLSGAAFSSREAFTEACFMSETGPVRLSEEGKELVDIMRVVGSNRRGTPYTPFAFLVSYARSPARDVPGAPLKEQYFKMPYTKGDQMFDVAIAALLEYPKNTGRKHCADGSERVSNNSKYGDLFDGLVADFTDSSAFRKILPTYPCALLMGEYADNPELEQTMVDYVREGGTLVVNVEQLKGAMKAFAGGEVIHRDAQGRDVFAAKKLGKGSVIVSLKPWMVPEDFNREQYHKYFGNPPENPDYQWLYDKLYARFSPVTVDGFVEWGLNKVEKAGGGGEDGEEGWLLYLVNNAGVTNFHDEVATFSPEGESVSVDLSRLNVKSAREIITGKAVRLDGKILRTTIPSGDLQIFELK